MSNTVRKVTANATSASPLDGATNFTAGRLTITNEGLEDVRLYCPGDGSTPTASAVVASGVLIKPGAEHVLEDMVGGEDLGQWWVATSLGTSVVAVTA